MIVDPDFADHWKTELLVNLTGSEASIRCLLRFWSHCQNRRKWQFEGMTPQLLAAICKWPGDPQIFWDAMTKTFLDVKECTIVAHEWESLNSRLVHNWEAGKKGGRPPYEKHVKNNPRVSQGYPLANPRQTDRGIDRGIDRERERACAREQHPFCTLSIAVASMEPEFPDVPVKTSLSDLVQKKGKEYLTEFNCRNWLKNERRRKKQKPNLQILNFEPPAESRECLQEVEARSAALAELAQFRNGNGSTGQH